VTDYATASLTLTVPGEFDVVASGTPRGVSTMPAAPGARPRKKYVFEAAQPTRYLSCLISRFQFAQPVSLKLRDDANPVLLAVAANPHQFGRARALTDKASDILKFYGSLMADAPYDSFTLALTESDLPGGHSPSYFAVLKQPLPSSPFVWTNDRWQFANFPSFFIAHELAHQWWGQAIGWKNYHEQWISEGFSQYFAAMYAERERGPEAFASVLRQMRRWAVEMSPQGPVYLGYRLGHIKDDGRVFRALVYNKGAMVLHMLRRLMGDEAFFAGLREFYVTWRYNKAGTDDFRVRNGEGRGRAAGAFLRPLDLWRLDSRRPLLVTGRRRPPQRPLRSEGRGVRRSDHRDHHYADGKSEDVVVKVVAATTEMAIPLKGAVRSIEVNKDGGSLAEIERSGTR